MGTSLRAEAPAGSCGVQGAMDDSSDSLAALKQHCTTVQIGVIVLRAVIDRV